MARFFFHVQTVDGVSEEDEIGADFPSEKAAIQEAEALAHEMMVDATKAGHNVKTFIEVANAHGHTILRLDCTAAIEARATGGLRDQNR
jgi:hypothetical protein